MAMAIPIAAAVVGSMISADATEEAANTQAQSARDAAATQAQAREQTRRDLMPYTQSGSNALNLINQGFGTAPVYSGPSADELRKQLLPQFTSQGAAGAAPAQTFQQFAAAHGGNSYHGTRDDAAEFQQNLKTQYEQSQGQQAAPTIDEAGLNAEIQKRMQGTPAANAANGGIDPGYFNHVFDKNDLTNGLSPNYDWIKSQGQGALNNQLAAVGGLVGGNAVKGAQDYVQGLAGNAYQQAFNNYQSQRGDIFDRLNKIAGMGQASAAGQANLGQQYASNIGSAQLAGGQAQAAGTLGANKAMQGGLNSAVSQYQLNNMMHPDSGTTGASTTTGAGTGGNVMNSSFAGSGYGNYPEGQTVFGQLGSGFSGIGNN